MFYSPYLWLPCYPIVQVQERGIADPSMFEADTRVEDDADGRASTATVSSLMKSSASNHTSLPPLLLSLPLSLFLCLFACLVHL